MFCCVVFRRVLPWLVVVSVLFVERASFAQADEMSRLENELDAAFAALAEVTAADCGSACEALASMRRAAARICELDPGPPCEAARQKLEEATRRVRDACPGCLEANLEERPEKLPAGEPPGPRIESDDGAVVGDELADEEAEAISGEAAPAAAPQAERRGGCASCTVEGGGQGSFVGLLLGLGVLAWRRRRR